MKSDLLKTGFLMLLLVVPSIGCSCVDSPLKERFRNATAVFVGGLYDIDEGDKPNVQNYRDGTPVLLVKRSWKGIGKELVAIDFDFPKQIGACPLLDHFDEGVDYLVFAYGKDLEIRAQCSDTHKLTNEYTGINRDMRRLDSFWFRFGARVWPF